MKDYRRLKTDAIKENLIPSELTPAQVAYTYANEADMLNVVLFGKTAKQWKGPEEWSNRLMVTILKGEK